MSLLGIEEMCDTFLNNLDSNLPRCCEDIKGKLKSGAPWKDRTGTLRNTMQGKFSGGHGDYNMEFSYGQNYGEYFENGAAPHEIVSKSGGYMFGEGLSHPIKHANHPGIKATHHLEKTCEGSVGEIVSVIISSWPG